ncbi:PD-(D/E)XK motif protein, partial [bacterium]|nr:PD-(D/E)XK motif protein [bacterium]
DQWIFEEFVVGMLGYFKRNIEDDAIATIASVLSEWRAFFEGRHGDKRLTQEQQIGLWGELYILNTMLVANANEGDKILEFWTGPSGAAQDFQCNNNAVEVKAMLSRKKNVKISSLEQLNHTGMGKLFLTVVSLSADKEGSSESLTLANMVALLRETLKDALLALSGFERRLGTAGYYDKHEDYYNRAEYSVDSIANIVIDENTPVISYANTPITISSGIYKLNVGSDLIDSGSKQGEVSYYQILTGGN